MTGFSLWTYLNAYFTVRFVFSQTIKTTKSSSIKLKKRGGVWGRGFTPSPGKKSSKHKCKNKRKITQKIIVISYFSSAEIVMACSKPIKYKNLLELTHSKDEFIAFLKEHKLIFSFEGPCGSCVNRQLILRVDNTTRDGYRWRCTNKKCNHKLSFRKDSFFSGSQLPLATITEIIYCWTYKYQQEVVIHETGQCNHTIIDFYRAMPC